MKNKIALKQQHKQNIQNEEPILENSHAGLAIPVTMEELEQDHHIEKHSGETSTSNAGLSTWILLSNPSSTVNPNKEVAPDKDIILQVNTTESSETTKYVKKTTTQRPKPPISKNKPSKKPQTSNPKPSIPRRPIIASSNKSDLIAGGSAVNENVLNKIKASVLANVQKNKNAALNRTTTPAPNTSISPTPQVTLVTKKDFTTKIPTIMDKHTSLPIQSSTDKAKIIKVKKQKHKNRRPVSAENKLSAQLPMEAKDQEIELEVSTPSTTTKKPKRTSTKRKKNKTRKQKPSTPKPTTSELLISETKVNNNSKVASKPALKQKPISTQIYNYLSREVMPTVGVGIVGLAGLVGLASYFLYPFGGPVRRAYDFHDKKDDLYRHNAEDYAHDGNGQAEEDMLGTVLAGIPSNSNNRINPYLNQTPHRYPQNKKDSEQNIRYRNVAGNNEGNNQNSHYSQQKTGLAHGVMYSDPINYETHYESENKNDYSEYAGEEAVYSQQNPHSVSVYPLQSTQSDVVYPPQNVQSEIVYPSENAPSGPTSYESQSVNSVYAMKPNEESNFEPVYPFEGQVFSDTTHNPIPTSMYLGSDDESRHRHDQVYAQEPNNNNPDKKPQFVVGNVPKELIQPITPAVVPEHGPRSLNRKKRSLISNNVVERSIADAIGEILVAARDDISNTELNEIDEALDLSLTASTKKISTSEPKGVTIVSVKPNIRTTNSQNTTFTDSTKHARSSEMVSESKYDFSTISTTAFNEIVKKNMTRTSTIRAEDFLTNTNSGATTVLTTTSLEDRPLTLTGTKSFSTVQTSTLGNVQPYTIENKEHKTLTESYTPTSDASTATTDNKQSTSNSANKFVHTESVQSPTSNDISEQKEGRPIGAATQNSDIPESAATKLQGDITRVSRKMKSEFSPSSADVQDPIFPTEYYGGKTTDALSKASESRDDIKFSSSKVVTSSDTPSTYQTPPGTQLKLTDKDVYHTTSNRASEISESGVENISTHPLGTIYSYYNGDTDISSPTHTDNKRDTSTTFKDTSSTANKNEQIAVFEKSTEARTTESELSNEIDVTTKLYKIYEVFTSTEKAVPIESIETKPTELERQSTENKEPSSETQTSTTSLSTMTSVSSDQKTTEKGDEKTYVTPTVTSTLSTTTIFTEMSKNESPESDPETLKPSTTTSVPPPSPGANPSYPQGPTDHNHKPQNNFSVLSFLKNLIEFKFRLGMSILQTTSESLARYLRGMESTMREMAKSSGNYQKRHRD